MVNPFQAKSPVYIFSARIYESLAPLSHRLAVKRKDVHCYFSTVLFIFIFRLPGESLSFPANHLQILGRIVACKCCAALAHTTFANHFRKTNPLVNSPLLFTERACSYDANLAYPLRTGLAVSQQSNYK